jgi:hypothetical protein
VTGSVRVGFAIEISDEGWKNDRQHPVRRQLRKETVLVVAIWKFMTAEILALFLVFALSLVPADITSPFLV